MKESKKKITVSIVEDDLSFQDWILEELELEPNIACISKFTKGEEAIIGLQEKQPDIVLMDLELNGAEINGIACMAVLKVQYPDLKFLVISSHDDNEKLFSA
ncbi:MAG: response regulator, partial [Bacteroidota bacterium]